MIDYNYYIEYWVSCIISNRNDFPELFFRVLGGGEVFGSLKLDFFEHKMLFSRTGNYTYFANLKHVVFVWQEARN